MFTMTRIRPASRRTVVTVASLVLAGTVAMALVGVAVVPSLVRAADPISFELLTARAQFTDDVDAQIRFKLDGGRTTVLNMPDASRTLVARFTVQPGAQFPWHTHPGPVIVNIVQGELIYVQASDCVERAYPAGTVFVDPGRGNVHSAFNPSETVPTIFVATFLDFPADGPLSIPAASQAHCATSGDTHGGH